jgi:integrase
MRQLRRTVKTYEAAKKELTKLQRQVDEDKHPKSDITVRQAIEQWLDVAALEDTTRERYQDLIRLYILPTFGHLQAAKLDAELLERFYARLHRCRDMCTGRPRAGHTCRPLSTSTTRKVHYIIRGALERAVRWRHLGVNKAAMAVAPSPERTEPDPPSADEAARLLNAAWSDPEWGLLLWLTMLTGPRRGEISALRWRHIDFERGLLSIVRSNAQPKAGVKEKHTKTGQARKIALDAHTVELLTAHRQRWEQRLDDLGLALSPDAFVFSTAPTARRRTCPGRSASATASSRSSSSCAAPAYTRYVTTPRPNSSRPASTSAPSPAASATAAAAPQRSRSMRAGSTKPTAAPPTPWQRSSPSPCPHPLHRADRTRSSPSLCGSRSAPATSSPATTPGSGSPR